MEDGAVRVANERFPDAHLRRWLPGRTRALKAALRLGAGFELARTTLYPESQDCPGKRDEKDKLRHSWPSNSAGQQIECRAPSYVLGCKFVLKLDSLVLPPHSHHGVPRKVGAAERILLVALLSVHTVTAQAVYRDTSGTSAKTPTTKPSCPQLRYDFFLFSCPTLHAKNEQSVL